MREMYDMGLPERTVTVNRKNLLEKLRENLTKHRREYEEAVAGYKTLARERLEKTKRKAETALADNFGRIKQKIDRFDPEDENGLADVVTIIQSQSFNLKVPKDHSDAYRVAIQMAEWEVSDTVELTQGQFQCFVLDDWDWQKEFQQVTKMYNSFK